MDPDQGQTVCKDYQQMTKVISSKERDTVKPVLRGHSKIDKTKI